MNYRMVMAGEHRLAITDSLTRLLNQQAQRRYPSTEDREHRKTALARIKSHAYLIDDPWSAAEHRHQIARAKVCQEAVAGLKQRLERGEISYRGLEAATGTPHLNADRLLNHSLRTLDLSPDWLLLSVARHPEGGNEVGDAET